MTTPQTPYVQNGKLYSPTGDPICAVGPRTGWLDWLERDDTKSFRFIATSGATFTAIREPIPQRSGNVLKYWYAHRQIMGKLKRLYLGRSAKLSLPVLERMATRIAQLEMKVGDATMPGGGALLGDS